MASGKKGFVLYANIIHTVKKLPKEKQGELFMTILEYVNDLDPIVNDLNVDLVFEPIKQQLKIDLAKWEVRGNKSRENGKLGGRPKNLNKPKKPSRLNNNLTEPRKPVIVNDSVNVSVSDNVKVKDNVILKEKEKEKLIEKFGFVSYEWMIEKLSNYKLAHGKKYKSDYGAINSWVVKEWEKHIEPKTKKTTTGSEEFLNQEGMSAILGN